MAAYKAYVVKSMGSRHNLATVAASLFRLLREVDEEGVAVILAESVPQEGLGLAVMNRLRKASGYHIIKAVSYWRREASSFSKLIFATPTTLSAAP